MGSGRCGGQAPQPLMGSDHEGGPFVGFFHVQANLAGVMCDHGRGVEQAEPKAFRFPEATCVALRRFGGECGFRRGEWWVGVEVPEDQERPSFRIDSRGPRRVSRYGVR